MGFFNRLFENLSDLSTWIVELEKDGNWKGWSIEGNQKVTKQPDLLGVLEEIKAMEKVRYANSSKQATAELQVAIYPWKGGGDGYLFLIEENKGGFTATDRLGSGRTVSGVTLDELIHHIESQIYDYSKAMLQWLRPIKEL